MADASPGVNSHPATAFVQLPQALIFDARLSAVDLRVACVLLTYTRPGKPEAWPSQETIADSIALSVDTVQRALKSLQAFGYLLVRRLRDRLGRLGKNVYNLAAVAGLLPGRAPVNHAAPARFGVTHATPKPSPSIPHPCGILKKTNSLHAKEQQQAEPTERTAEPLPEPDPVVVLSLEKRNISRTVAERVARLYPRERVKAAALAVDAYIKSKSGGDVNRLIQAAARDGWTPNADTDAGALGQTATQERARKIQYVRAPAGFGTGNGGGVKT